MNKMMPVAAASHKQIRYPAKDAGYSLYKIIVTR